MATSKNFDLSSTIAIEDAAIAVSTGEHASKTATEALIAAIVSICPTDKAGQKKWLAEALPALVRGWDAQRGNDGALIVAADDNSTRSARKRLISAVKMEVEGNISLDFSFIGKSKKTKEGINISYYEWISTEEAEELADDRERAAAERKAKKEKEAIKAETAKISQAVADATKGMVPASSIVDPATCSDEQAVSMLAQWARECTKRGIDVQSVILRNTAPAKPAMPATGSKKAKAKA